MWDQHAICRGGQSACKEAGIREHAYRALRFCKSCYKILTRSYIPASYHRSNSGLDAPMCCTRAPSAVAKTVAKTETWAGWVGLLVTWSPSSAVTPLTLSQPNRGSVYPDKGASGSDPHSAVAPEKRGLHLHFYLLAWLNHKLRDYPIC